MKRRDALGVMAAAPVLAMCRSASAPHAGRSEKESAMVPEQIIKSTVPLGFQWPTLDPFLFCVHHDDRYPGLDGETENRLELLQIWLNLPSRDKLVAPYFSMLWSTSIPRTTVLDASGRKTELAIIAGKYETLGAPPPPPNSWASRRDADVAIWTLKMDPGALFTLPRGAPGSNRMLYYFSCTDLRVAGRKQLSRTGLELRAE